nr:hypothetical protein BaRGS_017190 [Batillaria attramentaria]
MAYAPRGAMGLSKLTAPCVQIILQGFVGKASRQRFQWCSSESTEGSEAGAIAIMHDDGDEDDGIAMLFDLS